MTSMSGSRGAAGNKIPKGYAAGRLQQFTPEQMGLFQQLFSHTGPGSQLSRQAGGDLSSFAPQEELAQRDFQNFSGDLASRFSGLGMGARRGSGFQNLATQGAQDFALQLSGQRQQLQRQALMDLMGLSSTLLDQRPYENFLVKKQQKPSFGRQLLGAGLPIAGAIAGSFGGPAGAALGGQLGSTFASGFTGQPSGGSYEGISDLPTSWKSLGTPKAQLGTGG